MKILKYALFALGGLIVVIGAVLAYVAATFDPNQYKPQIVQAVKDKTQRTLKLDGDIKLSLFPSIGGRMGKATLSERASDKEFAAVQDLRIAVKLMPLLSKEVVVDAVEVKGLRANLTRFKDGTTNMDDLAGTPGAAKPQPKTKEAPGQVNVDIASVGIEDAAITFTDQQAGAKYVLSKVNLKTGRIASGVPTKIELALAAQSDKPKLDLEGDLKVRLTFDLENKRYALEGLDLSAKGNAAGISNLSVKAKGDVDARLATNEFVASKLAVTATGKQAGGDLNVKLDLPKLNITKDKVSGDKIVLDATTSEAKRKLVAKVEIPALEGNAQAFKAGQMTANLDLQQEGAKMQAKLTSPIAGSVTAQRIELSKLAATVKLDDPKLPKNPIDATITGSALLDLAKQTANLTFATKLDDSNINGRAGLARFTPPSYTFDINVDRLDADRYMAKSETKGKPGGQPSEPKGKPREEPFDLTALKDLNANGTVKIGSLKVSNVKVSNIRLDVKGANGRLDVSPLTANLYQGSLAGALSVNAAATPAFAVKQNLTGVSIGPLLKDLADNDTLEGKGNVALDVTARGDTVTALKKALNGTAALDLADGALKGINIAGSIRNAKATLGTLRGEKVQQADKSEKTDFSELKATFNIKNGVAHSSDLSLKSPLLRVGGEGDVNLGEDSINYLIKASIVGTSKGQGGRELAELQGVTVPVRVTGPLAAPSYKLDFNAMATDAVKQKLEDTVKRRIEERLGRGGTMDDKKEGSKGGSLRDSLKGLFGR